MLTAKYRIDQLRIEGFRGFTKPQTFDLSGKHVFVFGQNGRGKSSIVEAIRWCLFGASGGTDIEVRNTFYEKQECSVSLVLKGEDGVLHMQRDFRPGHDRESRGTIRDGNGKEVRGRDVLPQLTRLGPHESTQVIFAAQHAAGRQLTDISDFGSVLCFYLRLEHVPELFRRLKALHEERAAEAERLAKKIEEVEHGYREKLREVQTRLDTLLGNPPWGQDPTPTGNETGDKITEFTRGLARVFKEDFPSGKRPPELLQISEQWIEAHAKQDSAQAQARYETLLVQLAGVDNLLATVQQKRSVLAEKEVTKKTLEEKQRFTLAGETRASLETRVAGLENAQTEKQARSAAANQARKTCEESKNEACPACGTTFPNSTALFEAVKEQCARNTVVDAELNLLTDLRTRVLSCQQLEGELEHLVLSLGIEKNALASAATELSDLLGLDPSSSIETLEERVAELRSEAGDLQRQIENADAERQTNIRRVRELQQEQKYHEYRDRTKQLEWRLGPGMEDARELLSDYRNLLARVEEVRRLVEQAFNEAVDAAIPTLDEMFTDVYRRLTQQVSYDLVRTYRDPEKTGVLELRVASGRLPDQKFPVNVLNGQASRALHLVPYFVFSRFQPEIMELDLLLIDDPSESFDTSHIGFLVQELAQAAKHAQIFVASHELDKFDAPLREQFENGSYFLLEVDSFDPAEGPRVARR